jgi:hypothetical protein
MRKLSFALIGGLLLMLGVGSAQAEQYVDVGDYIIHYHAMPTDLLTPDVARAYGIQRSQARAMLNITVMRKGQEGELNTPVEAKVGASATNLTGQRREMEMRLIAEQEARYYVGFVRVANEETVEFKIQVVPDGITEPFEVAFRQKFYVDGG